MRLFYHLYQHVMQWSKHRHAPYYLAGMSFIESSFFPIPPDVMLAPMCLAKPARAWRYAALTTLASVLGALLGYVLGLFFFSWVKIGLVNLGYLNEYQHIQSWFFKWGAWVMFIAAFSPIPFKLFTIAAGVLKMNLIPFILGSLLGRSMRFYLVAALMHFGGERMDLWLKRFVDWIGWGVLVLLGFVYGVYQLSLI